MAEYRYTDTENCPISVELTIHDLKVLDRVLTEYIDPDQWGYEKQLHREIRQILQSAYVQMGDEYKYVDDRFTRITEYNVKLKAKKSEVDA